MTDKTKTCEVTVTVSGAQGSGKTTLMAVLAQALRGSGHDVVVPDHTPSASRAISDLSLPYRVTFHELEPGQESLTLVVDTKDIACELQGYVERIEELDDALSQARQEAAEASARHHDRGVLLEEYRETNVALAQERDKAVARAAKIDVKLEEFRNALMARSRELHDLRERIPSASAAEQMITKALNFARESVIIDRDRQEVVHRSEALKQESAKMRRESEARLAEARGLMMEALTGERPQAKSPADIQMERRVAARQLSATDKLALANGARPVTSAEQVVAAAVDESAHAIADAMADDAASGFGAQADHDYGQTREASLASEVERRLMGGTPHPLIQKMLEGRA